MKARASDSLGTRKAPCFSPAERALVGRLRIDLALHHEPSMSAIPSASTSQSNFVSVFNAAIKTYKRKTKKDLASHPLLPTLQSCDSPEAILTVLREQIPGFDESQNGDDGLTKWVTPTVNVLYSFSSTIGGGVGLASIRLFLREEFRL